MRLSSYFRVLSLASLFSQVTSTPVLVPRNLTSDFEDAKDYLETEVAKEVADGLADIDGIIVNHTISYSETPPIRCSLTSSFIDSTIVAGLYDPDEGYLQPAAFAFANDRYQNWNDGWFGVALESFDALVEVDIDLSASANGNITLSLLQKSVTNEGVTAEIDFQLFLTAEASASMSFTAGLNLSLANPAAIMMPALENGSIIDITNATNVGFSTHDFTLTPIFNASMPQLEFDASLSLRTMVSLNVEGFDVGALYLDLPAFDLGVSTLHDMMSNCQSPPAGAPPDQIYSELIHLDGTLNATLSYEIFDDEYSNQLGSWAIANLLDNCYAFFPGSGHLGPVPASSKDPALTAAAVTTGTTGGNTTAISLAKALSSGEKAGIGIGTVVGISLIAALAFIAGRASQRHSDKTRGTDRDERGSRLWFGNVFKSNHRPGTDKFVYTSAEPIQQSDNESGNFIRTPAAETEVLDRQLSWLRRKPVPTVDRDTRPKVRHALTGEYDAFVGDVGETGSS